MRNFRSLHELFHVYVDEENILRTDHKISFVGLNILRLHYKMTLARDTVAPFPETNRAFNVEQAV